MDSLTNQLSPANNPAPAESAASPPPLPPFISPPSIPCPDLAAPTRPWGFWATLGFSLTILIAGFMAQAAVGMVFAVVAIALGHQTLLQNPEALSSHGLMLSLATLGDTPVVIGLSILFAWLRKGIAVKEYLGFKRPAFKEIRRWCLWLLLMVVATDCTSLLTGRSIVPDFMVKVYHSAGFLPLLWFVIVVAAPVSEEIIFRGFFFTGLEHSRVGGIGAIVITSLVWAAIHLQYDVYGMGMIFVGGLLLGLCRLKTGSVWLCICLHALMNLIATIELVYWPNVT